jgi:hypothetical protein
MHKKNVELFAYCKQLESQHATKDETINQLREQLLNTTSTIVQDLDATPRPPTQVEPHDQLEPPLTPSKQNKIPSNYITKAESKSLNTPPSPTKPANLFTPSSPNKLLITPPSPKKGISPSQPSKPTPPSPSLPTSPDKKQTKRVTYTVVKDVDKNNQPTLQFGISSDHIGLLKETSENIFTLPVLYAWYRTGSVEYRTDSRIHTTKAWENKLQHHISQSSKNIILHYKLNASLNYAPAVKVLRVRYQGENSFCKITVNTVPYFISQCLKTKRTQPP